MNDSIYEEYMRSVLGFQPVSRNTYDTYYEMPNMTAMSGLQIQELENCYPEIYRIIYPMVQKACNQNRGNITKESIEGIINEIYSAIEETENRQSNKNESLNDLIRILVIRELLGEQPPRPPMRPPMGPPPPPPPRRMYI